MSFIDTNRVCYLMSSFNGISRPSILWIYLVFSQGAVVLGQAAGPNAVVSMNGQATLDCVVVQMAYTQWSRTSDGSSNPSTIAFGCSVIGSNSDYYSTEQPGGNVCRLIIGNATMQQAGVYGCYDGSSITFRSLVTAIDPVANVVVYNQSEIVEDDHLNISCSINYTGPSSPAPSIRPSPYFTSHGQSFTSLTYYPSANIVTVVATVQVQKPKVPIFWCNTVFEITGNTSSYNATPPADNMSLGATTELDVRYSPRNINITSTVSASGGCIYKQENLTCTADGHPQAQYEWMDRNSNSTTTGSVVSIASGGQYRCTAFNTIRSQRYNITQTVSEVSCYPVVENNMTISGSGCTNGLCDCNGSQPLELTCEVYSLPTPTYQWCWNNLLQIEYFGNQVIRVTYDGTYSCTASNSFSMATVSVGVFNCSVPPSTPPSVVSESTATITTTGSTTAGSSGDNGHVSVAAAIAVGAILFISLALNIMLLIIMIKNMRPKHDPFKRAGTNRTILSPETLDLSNEPPAPATYEELTRSNEIHLQPTYDKLTPKPPAPATYQELTHPDEIHLQPPTYEKLTTKPPSYVDDLS